MEMNKRSRVTLVLLGLILVGSLLGAGCATLFTDSEDEISFRSNVDPVKIIIDGNFVGETPITIPVDRKLQKYKVKFSKEGYDTQEIELAHKFNSNAWVIIDITASVTTFYTPMGIDALSGALIQYTPKSYQIEMMPTKTGDAGKFHQRIISKQFAASNYDNLRRDLVFGKGEYLGGLQKTFMVPPQHSTPFEELLLQNKSELLKADDGLELWDRINEMMGDHPSLKFYQMG